MKLLLLVVCASAFQTENGDQFARGPAPSHTENHIRDCQLLDATHPFFSQFDPVEHDCDVSSNAIDTVEADTVMDMNELTCNLFCGKISHGDCQCDETECDKNDQLVADTPTKDSLSMGEGGPKCIDADSPVTPGLDDTDPETKPDPPCKVDFECTMNGPMSYCGEAPETVDVAICKPTPDLALVHGKNDKWHKAATVDELEGDWDVSTQVADLQRVDSIMDSNAGLCEALCGTHEKVGAKGGDCQCDEAACDGKDKAAKPSMLTAISGAIIKAAVAKGATADSNSACDLTDTCEQDFECLYLGGLEYCGQVSHEGAATFDVKMCNEIS